MVTVIGVRFRTAGKIYYFDPDGLEIAAGQHVIVETARGAEYGKVSIGTREIDDALVVQPLKKIMRLANDEDAEIDANNRVKEKEARKICLEKIAKHGLEMKLIDVEYTFDNNKILFYFTADGRIDFRELVKDLASVFKTRIELRQIGVRDETKMFGGIGICGRALCCHSYMPDFVPVSIKMAKEQTLSPNPTKISGVCGKLMCCLKYEQDTYEYLNSKLPRVGDHVVALDGTQGVIGSVNVMRQRVKVIVTLENDEKEAKEYSVNDITVKDGSGRRQRHHEDAVRNTVCCMENASDNVSDISAEMSAETSEGMTSEMVDVLDEEGSFETVAGSSDSLTNEIHEKEEQAGHVSRDRNSRRRRSSDCAYNSDEANAHGNSIENSVENVRENTHASVRENTHENVRENVRENTHENVRENVRENTHENEYENLNTGRNGGGRGTRDRNHRERNHQPGYSRDKVGFKEARDGDESKRDNRNRDIRDKDTRSKDSRERSSRSNQGQSSSFRDNSDRNTHDKGGQSSDASSKEFQKKNGQGRDSQRRNFRDRNFQDKSDRDSTPRDRSGRERNFRDKSGKERNFMENSGQDGNSSEERESGAGSTHRFKRNRRHISRKFQGNDSEG